MKLIRCGAPRRERPGVLMDDGRRVDVSAFARDFDEAFFADGGIDGLRSWLQAHAPGAPATLPAAGHGRCSG